MLNHPMPGTRSVDLRDALTSLRGITCLPMQLHSTRPHTVMATILQLSDPHLRANDELIRGIPPLKSLETVLIAARQYCPDPDCIVWTGDMSDDGSEQSYQHMRNILGDWFERSLWIPGNHDNRKHMRSVLLDQHVDSEELISFCKKIEGWRLLGLDTTIPGETTGELRLSQWKDLQQTWEGEPMLLFMHHPPATVECQWLDRISLINRDTFEEILLKTSSICASFSGHIHCEYERNKNGVRICTTPSTLFQFARSTSPGMMEHLPPGFRAIHLDGATLETQVIRLPELVYPPSAE